VDCVLHGYRTLARVPNQFSEWLNDPHKLHSFQNRNDRLAQNQTLMFQNRNRNSQKSCRQCTFRVKKNFIHAVFWVWSWWYGRESFVRLHWTHREEVVDANERWLRSIHEAGHGVICEHLCFPIFCIAIGSAVGKSGATVSEEPASISKYQKQI
jgi:hypothetical protein